MNKAWDLIPEPREALDFYTSDDMCIVWQYFLQSDSTILFQYLHKIIALLLLNSCLKKRYSSVLRALAGLCAFFFSLHCYKEEKSDIYRFSLHEHLVFYLLH